MWRKYYPVVHAWGATEAGQEHGLAAPTQLQQVNDAGLYRVVTLNARLIGPTPYRGGDVSLVAGLYSVPGDDAAQALITTVSALTVLVGSAVPTGGVLPRLSPMVLIMFGLSNTTLRLGICDTFYPGNPLRTGFHVGLGTDSARVDIREAMASRRPLWSEARDPFSVEPLTDCDYLVVEVERREVRDDWPGLPGMSELQEQLEGIMKFPHDPGRSEA